MWWFVRAEHAQTTTHPELLRCYYCMMKFREYNDFDPLSVLHLTMLALDFPLTPEYVARIRRTDPRPFPCLAVYAVEDEIVIGQVGVFRLPMISTEGREDVGGSGRYPRIRIMRDAELPPVYWRRLTPECARQACALARLVR